MFIVFFYFLFFLCSFVSLSYVLNFYFSFVLFLLVSVFKSCWAFGFQKKKAPRKFVWMHACMLWLTIEWINQRTTYICGNNIRFRLWRLLFVALSCRIVCCWCCCCCWSLLTCCNRFTLTAFRFVSFYFFLFLVCKAGLSLIIFANIVIVAAVAVVAVLKFTSALILTCTLVFHF